RCHVQKIISTIGYVNVVVFGYPMLILLTLLLCLQVTLLSSGPEVQYVALRNILLIIQRRPEVLKNDMKVFFCKYNDPIYVKLAKLEIMSRLANATNVDQVLSELKEWVFAVD